MAGKNKLPESEGRRTRSRKIIINETLRNGARLKGRIDEVWKMGGKRRNRA